MTRLTTRLTTVDLLSTLLAKGISGTALQWFESYLSDRSFKVSWRGEVSKSQHLTTGVLQGSVLGPLLFSVYYPLSTSRNQVLVQSQCYCQFLVGSTGEPYKIRLLFHRLERQYTPMPCTDRSAQCRSIPNKPKQTINNGRRCVAIDVHGFVNLHRHPNTANPACSCLAAISNMAVQSFCSSCWSR